MIFINIKYLNDEFKIKYINTFTPGHTLSQPVFTNDKKVDLVSRRLASLALVRGTLVEGKLRSKEEVFNIHIQRKASGQPYFEGEGKLPGISISHSGRWMACALTTREDPVGLDIEDITSSRPLTALARHAFFADEVRAVENGGRNVFYKLWGAKEAIAKCYGKGLTQALSLNVSSVLKEAPVKDGEHTFYLHQEHREKDVSLTLAQQNWPLEKLVFL